MSATSPDRPEAQAPTGASPAGAGAQMAELTRAECLELLAGEYVGRLAVGMGNGPPLIRPVNYLFDDASQSVVLRTAAGSKLHVLLRRAKAAFEIDGFDRSAHTGWSVIVLGVGEEVISPAEIHRLETLGVQPWVPGDTSHWVRIRAGTVSGRRIG
jgi:uncharacterized protein